MLHSKGKEREVLFIRFKYLLVLGLVLFISSSCNNQQADQESNYEQTKSMVIDILQTDEGKNVISDLIVSNEMKEHLVIASDVVKEAINRALLSDRGEQMWKRLFKDPSFLAGYAESISDSQKLLFKQLMMDPEYQEQMIDLLQNPELINQNLQLLKSQQFRSHLQSIISETLTSPLFQSEMAEILLKLENDKGEEGEEDESHEGNENTSIK